MEVISEGKWNNPWEHEYVCRETECTAKLLVKESDVRAPDYTSFEIFTFQCRVCGHTNPIPATDLHLRIKKTLNANRKISSSSD